MRRTTGWIVASMGVLALVAGVVLGGWVYRDASAGGAYRAALASFRERAAAPSFTSFAPPPIPAEEDAAPLYDDWEEGRPPAADAIVDALRKRSPGELSDADWQTLQTYVEKHGSLVNRLIEAANRAKCRRPLEYQRRYTMLMFHVSRCLARADLLLWDVRLRIRAGSAEGIWPRIRAITALGMSVMDEPNMVCQLVRIVILEKALDGAQEAMALGPPTAGWDERIHEEAMHQAITRAARAEFTLALEVQDDYFRGLPTETELDQVGWFHRLNSRPKLYASAARGIGLVTQALDAMDLPDHARQARLAQIAGEFSRGDPWPAAFLMMDLPKPWRQQRALDARLLLARRQRSGWRVPRVGPFRTLS